MNKSERRQLIVGTIACALVLLAFIIWGEVDKNSLNIMAMEDHPIEYATAFFLACTCICFIVAAKRSTFLKEKKAGLRYFMIISWAVLMFIFVGEEISWGQRIFGIKEPEVLSKINLQNETNLHNIKFIEKYQGGAYRCLTIMMIATGLLIPVFALFPFGKRTIQWFAFPVAPLGYWLIFIGGVIYGRYYTEILLPNDAAEVRELLMSLGMFAFAFHGALRPCVLFRVCPSKE